MKKLFIILMFFLAFLPTFSQNLEYLNYVDLRNKEAFDSYKHFFTFSKNEVYSPFFITFQYTQLYLATKKGTNKQLSYFALFNDDKNIQINNTKQYQNLIPIDNSITMNFKYSVNIFLPDTLKYLKSYQQNFDSLIADTIIPYVATDKNLAIKKINNVISENSFFEFKHTFDSSMISNNPNIISTSVAAYKNKWLYDFSGYTFAPFYLDSLGRSVKNTKYLYADITVKYAESPQYRIVILPYEDDNFSLVIVLPKKTVQIDTTLNFFNFDTFQMWKSKELERKRIKLLIPEFQIESAFNLKPLIKTFSPSLFVRGANYTAMIKKVVYLTDIYHFAKFELKADNENLTEIKNLKPNNTDEYLIANHPFIYFLINKKNHEIMFLGTFVNPVSKN